ncbi:PREDICTED: DNA damage-binding protein 2-like [Amphimedon queenslandica]|uniref:DNA damage-binding protein 2 n=1 Tax=Amphimedon queenslandica TaxID=400682 RepID=A0A1X7UA74_AMPQE|nr:PREDICTED: DNA damage-binding protein 2-like [Amphimedon queenslandica]|eukprot:XP_011405643.1 PREDICTED: DNA damage-binding protein 2-like [Amphimedon queenslandica]
MDLVSKIKLSSDHDATSYDLRHIREQLRDQFIEEATSSWRVVHTTSRFNRRVTCIEWHETYPHMVAFGSHAGDIHLCDTTNNKNDIFYKGVGFGHGSITHMTFSRRNPLHIYTTAVDGVFAKKDLEGKRSEVYLDTMDYKFWWTSFGISEGVMFVGGNTGNAVLLDSAGETIYTYHRFHKGKIQHAEFCPASENILVTSSNDKTATLWDLRTWGDSESPKPYAILKHEAPVNSAYFDPIHSSRLLTTAQNNKIRVYDSHNWDAPRLTMTHPHRQFQHMTHIKATWHPFYEDLCVIGRYPNSEDTNKKRCVDIIDLKKGVVAGQLYDPSMAQIMTVNQFNRFGDMLATGMGCNALLWSKQSPGCCQKDKSMFDGDVPLPNANRSQRNNSRSSNNNRSNDKNNRKRKGDTDTCTKSKYFKKKKLQQ